jgi:prolyl-tRNA editing enzyme YbaK/EbsC (Cys-tRNA(Pro) deacylase)
MLDSMTQNTHDAISDELIAFITSNAPSAIVFSHPACKTSEESMEARFSASGEQVPGAKALLVKLDIRERPDTFAVLVLPGFNKLDSKVVKTQLRQHIEGLRDFRFATAEEMARVARGLQPGKMPPFGRPHFPDIVYTFIDETLLKYPRIGFSAADFEQSIIMDSTEYSNIVIHDGIFACSLI